MEILKLLSMKRVFNYVLLVCVMFVLAACGTTKKTQTKEIPTQDFSQTAISLGNLDGYALKVFNCIGLKESQDVLLYFGFAHINANHDITLSPSEAFSVEGDIYAACIRNVDVGTADCFSDVKFFARTDETKYACVKIESVLPRIDKITEFRMMYNQGSPFYKSGEIIIKNIPIHWQ
jgi:hypothetical protein